MTTLIEKIVCAIIIFTLALLLVAIVRECQHELSFEDRWKAKCRDAGHSVKECEFRWLDRRAP